MLHAVKTSLVRKAGQEGENKRKRQRDPLCDNLTMLIGGGTRESLTALRFIADWNVLLARGSWVDLDPNILWAVVSPENCFMISF